MAERTPTTADGMAPERVSHPNPQRACLGLTDAEMPGDGMDVQEPKDQQHDGNQAHEG
jgi:hypothetical protein